MSMCPWARHLSPNECVINVCQKNISVIKIAVKRIVTDSPCMNLWHGGKEFQIEGLSDLQGQREIACAVYKVNICEHVGEASAHRQEIRGDLFLVLPLCGCFLCVMTE